MSRASSASPSRRPLAPCKSAAPQPSAREVPTGLRRGIVASGRTLHRPTVGALEEAPAPRSARRGRDRPAPVIDMNLVSLADACVANFADAPKTPRWGSETDLGSDSFPPLSCASVGSLDESTSAAGDTASVGSVSDFLIGGPSSPLHGASSALAPHSMAAAPQRTTAALALRKAFELVRSGPTAPRHAAAHPVPSSTQASSGAPSRLGGGGGTPPDEVSRAQLEHMLTLEQQLRRAEEQERALSAENARLRTAVAFHNSGAVHRDF